MNIVRVHWGCKNCGHSFLYKGQPKFCPECGGSNLERDFARPREHAQKVIEEMNEILPHAKAAYDEYAKWYVEFDNRKRLLVSYAMQGVIKKEDIPVFYKKSLIDYLYEYRAQRKKNKKS